MFFFNSLICEMNFIFNETFSHYQYLLNFSNINSFIHHLQLMNIRKSHTVKSQRKNLQTCRKTRVDKVKAPSHEDNYSRVKKKIQDPIEILSEFHIESLESFRFCILLIKISVFCLASSVLVFYIGSTIKKILKVSLD
ncbi:hypothetical protein DFJ63DRAFT_314734 [Scheffersomyces coipomensis]|uniref:uncharacterized protein n=1 Tax=Scheffersomyces coipomensis TaxID=1788519 RepID=UPI00315C9F3C